MLEDELSLMLERKASTASIYNVIKILHHRHSLSNTCIGTLLIEDRKPCTATDGLYNREENIADYFFLQPGDCKFCI